jgi:hypothetical protein
MSAAATARIAAAFDTATQAQVLEGFYREAISLAAKKLSK